MDTADISTMVANMIVQRETPELIYWSSYLTSILNPTTQKKVVGKIVESIQEIQKKSKVDAIAVRGMSGALVGGIAAHITGIPLICVRKEDSSHSDFHVEMVMLDPKPVTNYIIIDDLICTGKTINTIISDIDKEFRRIADTYSSPYNAIQMKAKPVGIILYNESPTAFNTWGYGRRKNIPVIGFRFDGFEKT